MKNWYCQWIRGLYLLHGQTVVCLQVQSVFLEDLCDRESKLYLFEMKENGEASS